MLDKAVTPLTYIIIGIVGGAIVVFLILRLTGRKNAQSEQYAQLNQRLDNLSGSINSINQALPGTIRLVADQVNASRESVERSTNAVHQQVQGFTTNLTQLREEVKQVNESMKSVSSFQDIFKSPKLRGIWGEASLEASLDQYFPKDRYELQHYFKSGEAVDAILRLPNDLLLPIDSKFNWENFQKMVEAENDIQHEQHKKTFFSDVKKKIDEISSKYILPSEKTTDFALMYVPAETVYYEIINNIKDTDIASYARSKKVIMTSPNTFFLSVSAINYWFKDYQTSKQTKEIIKRLDMVAKDAQKLSDDFGRLGKHLSDAHGSYESSEKRLNLMVDRVQNVLELEPPDLASKPKILDDGRQETVKKQENSLN